MAGQTKQNASSRISGSGSDDAGDKGDGASSFLAPLKLEKYAAAFDDDGYEDPDSLMTMSVEELVADLGMKTVRHNSLPLAPRKSRSLPSPPLPMPLLPLRAPTSKPTPPVSSQNFRVMQGS